MIPISVKVCTTVDLASGHKDTKFALLVANIFWGHQMRDLKPRHYGAIEVLLLLLLLLKEEGQFWGLYKPFDREYLENCKSERYMSIRAIITSARRGLSTSSSQSAARCFVSVSS